MRRPDARGAPPRRESGAPESSTALAGVTVATKRYRADRNATVTPDRPALGYFLSLPRVKAELEQRKWLSKMSWLDFRARRRALRRLVELHESARTGRRLDVLADDLHVLADELAAVPQRRCGGWPLREVA